MCHRYEIKMREQQEMIRNQRKSQVSNLKLWVIYEILVSARQRLPNFSYFQLICFYSNLLNINDRYSASGTSRQ